MSSSNNKLDKTGLAYFWNKASAYIQETIEYAQQLWVKIGNTSMGTTASTITGAIKEVVDKIGSTTMGTTATTLTGAIAEHEGDISNLNRILFTIFSDWSAYKVNGSTTNTAGTLSRNPTTKLCVLNIHNLITATTLTVGSVYIIGSVNYPPSRVNANGHINRADGGNAPCGIRVNKDNGQVTVYPLVSVPSGVVLTGILVWTY